MTGGYDCIATGPAALLRAPVIVRPARYGRQFWSEDVGPDSSAACGDQAFLGRARSVEKEDA